MSIIVSLREVCGLYSLRDIQNIFVIYSQLSTAGLTPKGSLDHNCHSRTKEKQSKFSSNISCRRLNHKNSISSVKKGHCACKSLLDKVNHSLHIEQIDWPITEISAERQTRNCLPTLREKIIRIRLSFRVLNSPNYHSK